jgi:hypothetical protein
MPFRNDVDALAARHEALDKVVTDRTRELGDAQRLLAEARQRAKLAVLDNIRVASPCSASWAAMTGDERVRACGECNKNVYNLTEMTREEAEALIVAKEGKLCVRYFQRHDGTILLKDCVIGARKRRRRRIVAIGVAAGLAASAITYLTMDRTTCERGTDGESISGGAVFQGEVAAPTKESIEERGAWLGGKTQIDPDQQHAPRGKR